MFGIRNYPEERLLSDIIAGGQAEGKAIRFLIKKNLDKVIKLIRSRNGSTADAEDVFQEALTALVLNIRKGSFKGDSSIHTYLFAICKGIWYKRFQKYVKAQEFKRNLSVVEEDVNTPEISLMNEEQKQLILELFESLRENCKEVLYMWASAFSMSEIAEKLNYSNAQVVMNKKNKCLKQLHQLMKHDNQIQNLLKEL